MLIANPQHNKLNPLAQDRLNNLRQEIKAFLIGQAADHSQQGNILTYRQMSILLQSSFVGNSLIKRLSIKTTMDIAISSRVILLIIDAVKDTKHTITARTQKMIKALTKGRRQNFLSIAFADRCNRIGKQDATPHNINNICQLCDLRIEKSIGGNASNLKNTIAKYTLIREVMNG